MKITKKQLEKRIGGYVDIKKVFLCPLKECYMSGEVDNCINGDYQNCDLYEKMLKGGDLNE